MSFEYGMPKYVEAGAWEVLGPVAPLADDAGWRSRALDTSATTRRRAGRPSSPAQDPGLRGHAAAHRQPPGHQGRAAGRAVGRARVEVRPPLALRGHPVEMRRAYRGMAVGSEVAPAQVVGHDQDDVRRGRRRALAAERGKRRHQPERGRRPPVHPPYATLHAGHGELGRRIEPRVAGTSSPGEDVCLDPAKGASTPRASSRSAPAAVQRGPRPEALPAWHRGGHRPRRQPVAARPD